MVILTNKFEFVIYDYELFRFPKIENITLLPLFKFLKKNQSILDKKYPLFENNNLVGEIVVKFKNIDSLNKNKFLIGDVYFFNKDFANLIIEKDFFIFPDIEIIVINDYYNYNYNKFLISKTHFINNSKIILKSFKQQKHVDLSF